MTDSAREAGRGQDPRPAREQVVIRDKRKIDVSGRPKIPAPGETGPPAGEAQAEPDTDAGTGEPTMGQPGTSMAAAKPHDGQADPAAPAKPATGKPATGKPATGKPATGGDDSGGETTGEAVGGPGGAKATATAGASGPLGAELEALRTELDERLRDLQRVSAEYANYRKRVERDRGAVVEQAVALVVSALLPILDDLDRAREHGDLVGPFLAMAEQLNAALTKFGLTGFGEPGDAFDPTRHEAVSHETAGDITEPTCVSVMRRGYLLGERLLRPALVGVADPA